MYLDFCMNEEIWVKREKKTDDCRKNPEKCWNILIIFHFESEKLQTDLKEN